jgi:hypothetical protein
MQARRVFFGLAVIVFNVIFLRGIPVIAQQKDDSTITNQKGTVRMVMTILEAHVVPEKWATLEQAYKAGTEHLPPQMVQTFLVHSTTDSTVWRIVSIWKSREALAEMRRSTETPGGVLIFRAAGAEPTLAIFDVVEHLAASAAKQ